MNFIYPKGPLVVLTPRLRAVLTGRAEAVMAEKPKWGEPVRWTVHLTGAWWTRWSKYARLKAEETQTFARPAGGGALDSGNNQGGGS